MSSKSISSSPVEDSAGKVTHRDGFLPSTERDEKGWRIYFSNSEISSSIGQSSSLGNSLVSQNVSDDSISSGPLGFLYDYYGMVDETRPEPPSPIPTGRLPSYDSGFSVACSSNTPNIDIPERCNKEVGMHEPEQRHSFPDEGLHTSFNYDNSESKRFTGGSTFKAETHNQFAVKKAVKSRSEDSSDVESQSLLRVHLPPQVPHHRANTLEDKYIYILEAQTSVIQRRDEDSLTYVNKGQFYNLTFESRYAGTNLERVKSVVHLVFRAEQDSSNELAHWMYWHGQQPNQNQRAFDVDRKACTGLEEPIEEVGYNALAFTWDPKNRVKVSVCINCLSTDFSSQKGVKGIPLHLQVDTYENLDSNANPIHRAFCQIKVFRDKGAERKNKDESKSAEKRMLKYMKHQAQGNPEGVSTLQQNISSLFQGANKVTVLHSTATMETKSVVFIPNHIRKPMSGSTSCATFDSFSSPSSSVESPQENKPELFAPQYRDRVKSKRNFDTAMEGAKEDLDGLTMTYDPKCSRLYLKKPAPVVTIYIRKEEEKAYHAIMLKELTLLELKTAIGAKYAIPPEMIANTMKKTKKGLLVNFDDQLVEQFVDEDDFIICMEFDNTTGTVDLVVNF